MAHILLGVTGSVGAKLTSKLASRLRGLGEVQILITESAKYFTSEFDWHNQDDWPGNSYTKDQDIPHIKLGDWADLLVVAPLSANTLTKFAVGLSDNLLTSLFYAWPHPKPVVLAPAMNTRMWENPLTAKHLAELTLCHTIPPVHKHLACGVTGMGGMADIETIYEKTREILGIYSDATRLYPTVVDQEA